MTRRQRIERRARRRWLRFAVQYEFVHRNESGPARFVRWHWLGRSYARYHGKPAHFSGEIGRIESVRFVCS